MPIHFYHLLLLVKTEKYPSLNINNNILQRHPFLGNRIEYGRYCEKYRNTALPVTVPHLLLLILQPSVSAHLV